MKKKNRLSIALGIILAIILLVGQCNYDRLNRDNDRLKNNIEALKDSVRFKKNMIGTLTAEKKVLEVTEHELKNQVFVKDEKLSKLQKEFEKVKSSVKVVTNLEIKEIPVIFKDTIQCVFEKKDSVRTEFYNFDVRLTNKDFTLKNVNIPNTQYTIIGQKKDGLFKPVYMSIEVTNTNKFLVTKDLTAQLVEVKQPFYNKFWFKTAIFLAGVTTGIVIIK